MTAKIPPLCNCVNFQCCTVFVGILHLALLAFRIYEFVVDLILLEDYLDLQKLVYLVFINVLQITAVLTLFIGVYKQNHFLFVPWLFFTGPVCVMTTVYAVLYSIKGMLLQSLLNFSLISIFWTCWLVVWRNYFNIKQMNQNRSYTDYKYTHLKTES